LLDRMIKGRKPDPKETREIKVQPWTWDNAFKAHRRALRRLRENGVEV
jgi:hypothetical protein